MNPTLTRLAATALAAAALVFQAQAADEDNYPSRPVKIIVPFPAAGSTDMISRRVAERLSLVTGQPFVVDNRPGAGGNIGAAVAAKSPADGYTVLLGTSGTQSVNPHLYKDLGFDGAKDFAAVSLLVRVPALIVINPELPAKDLQSFLAYVKVTPTTYGHPSVGSSKHVAAEDFKLRTGSQITPVAYKGSAPMLNDLLGGHIKVAFDEPLTSMAHIKSGRIVPIAITGPVRWPTLPDVPRVAEAGGALADYDVTGWFCFYVPTGTNPKVVQRLNAAIRKVFADEEFRKSLFAAGAEPVGSGVDEAEAFTRAEYQRWGALIRATDLKVN